MTVLGTSSRTRRRAIAAAVTAFTATALAACGSGSDSGGSASLIRYGSYAPLIAGFDPAQAQANQFTYLSPVYDTLLRQVPGGKLVPDLATSWSFTSPTTLELHLRDGVSFSDGEAFDADAVVANLKRTESSGGALASHLAVISSATATDATTVKLSLSAPSTSLLATLADLPGMMAAPKAFAKLATAPVGTGPWIYQADKSSAGASYFFAKNTKYWDAARKATEDLKIQVVQNYTAQLNALQSGQMDLTTVQANQVNQAKSAGLTVASVLGARLGMLIIDRTGAKVPALGKVGVRQAMNYAIDRAALLKALAPGEGVASAGFWQPGYWPADPSMADYYGYDPDKAKTLLADAGYPHGFTVSVGTIPVFQPWAEAIQQQYKQVGITLQLHVLENGVLGKTIHAGTYPIILTTGGGTSKGDPGTDVQQELLPDAPNNPEHYKDAQIETLATQADALTDQDKRQPIYQQIDKIVTTSALNVTVGYLSAIVVTRKSVSGLTVLSCGGAACVDFRGVHTS